ncbi:MAG TPA: hypothetical protein VN441_17520, partial [Syntrophomonas sp.]|nr:hypothetical protein [Syntrophomonas sp.]
MNSAGNPAAEGTLLTITDFNSACCSAVSLEGRPGTGLAGAPFNPSFLYIVCMLLTVLSDTPTILTTSHNFSN